jgi:ribosomal protein S6--L-glutamate ligase
MRFCVLGSPDGWYFRDLVRAASGRHEVLGLPFSRLWSESPGAGQSARHGVERTGLADFDAILVRSMPPGTLEQVVFRMDVLGCLEREGVVVVNPPRALEMAIDKFLSTARLQRAGLPTPATWSGQAGEEAMEAFARLGGDVVIKPLFGSEGRGLLRIDDPELAWRATRNLAQLGAVIYMQRFIPHAGYDYRVLVLGDRHLVVRRANDQDWRTNVSRGARVETCAAPGEVTELAVQASAAVGAPLAGVDILPGNDGNLYVLEVNAVPGWRGLAAALQQDVAGLVWDYVEEQVCRRRA